MNVGRYLRGEDRHVGTTRVSKEKQQSTVDIDPMDTPLPCAVKVGHVTVRKGVALRTLVMRMQVLYDMAQQRPSRSDMTWVGLTDDERDAIFELYHTRLGGWDHGGDEVMYDKHFEDAVAAIEAKLKEKNT